MRTAPVTEVTGRRDRERGAVDAREVVKQQPGLCIFPRAELGSKTPKALPQAAQDLQEHGSANTRPWFSLHKGFGKAPPGSTHPAQLL